MLGARCVGVVRAGRALVGALVVMGAMELATAGGHLGVAAVLERASDCFAVEQCEREYEHAFDETPLRTFGIGLAGAAMTVTVVAAWWLLALWRSRLRGGPAVDTDAGLQAAGLVLAAALAGLAMAFNAVSLPHYERTMDISRATIRTQVETAVLVVALSALVVIASVAVVRVTRVTTSVRRSTT